MKKFLSITLTVAMLLASAIGVSAYEANANGFVTIEVDGATLDKTLDGEYSLVVVKGLNTQVIDFSDANSILYIDQATADEGVVSFGEIGLTEATEATAFIGGRNLDGATSIGNITISSAPATTPVSSVTITPNAPTVEVGKTVTLQAEVLPANATDKTVAWASSADAVATVSNGVVTGVSAGTAQITATAGGVSTSVTVTVTAPASTTRTPGDAKEDGIIDSIDALWISRYIAGHSGQPNYTINLENADCDGNEGIDSIDALWVSRSIAENNPNLLK